MMFSSTLSSSSPSSQRGRVRGTTGKRRTKRSSNVVEDQRSGPLMASCCGRIILSLCGAGLLLLVQIHVFAQLNTNLRAATLREDQQQQQQKQQQPVAVGGEGGMQGVLRHYLSSLFQQQQQQQQQQQHPVDNNNDNDGGSTASETTQEDLSAASCKQKLDALERMWDSRRQARKDAISTGKGRGGPYQVFDLFEPEAVCLDDERFGQNVDQIFGLGRYKAYGDGPKFMCGIDRIIEKTKKTAAAAAATTTQQNCLIYSVGSNNEIEFEVSVVNTFENNCELHTFDPTIHPDKFVGHNYTIFHNWGLGEDGKETKVHQRPRGYFDFTAMSVVTAMKKLGHQQQGRTVDIFKIDCEGCEYTALTAAFNAIADGVIKIDQVQAELHDWEQWLNINKLFEAADRANMRVFHKERNAWGCGGTRCVEYAFVSNDFLRKANAHHIC